VTAFVVGQRVRVVADEVNGRFVGRGGSVVKRATQQRQDGPREVAIVDLDSVQDGGVVRTLFWCDQLEPIEPTAEWLPGTDPRVREWAGKVVECRYTNGSTGHWQPGVLSLGVGQECHRVGGEAASQGREFRLAPEQPHFDAEQRPLSANCSVPGGIVFAVDNRVPGSQADLDRALARIAAHAVRTYACEVCRDRGTVPAIDCDGEVFPSLCMGCRGKRPEVERWTLTDCGEANSVTRAWSADCGPAAVHFTTYFDPRGTFAAGVDLAVRLGFDPVGCCRRMVENERCHPMAAARVLAALNSGALTA
jgi:hypothetical protein